MVDYSVEHSEDGTVYRLSGRLGHSDNVRFTSVLTDIADGPGRRIVVDLANLEFMDSFGIGLMLIAADEARRVGNHLNVCRPTGAVHRLFTWTGLRELLADGAAAE